MSTLDRRTFLGSLSLTGAVLFAGWPPSSCAAPGNASLAGSSPAALHHVDDMWGHWPPYAHPIPHGGSQPAPLPWESIEPADRMWAAWR